MYKVNHFVDGERYSWGLLHTVSEGLNSFYSSETQKKILSDYMPKNMSVVSFSTV